MGHARPPLPLRAKLYLGPALLCVLPVQHTYCYAECPYDFIDRILFCTLKFHKGEPSMAAFQTTQHSTAQHTRMLSHKVPEHTCRHLPAVVSLPLTSLAKYNSAHASQLLRPNPDACGPVGTGPCYGTQQHEISSVKPDLVVQSFMLDFIISLLVQASILQIADHTPSRHSMARSSDK